ncbi:MAG TPA: hypothetical protein VJP02_10175, partial [Candidatus Sulfotelmatobacter sp.]|nr:hypothetical protein [Candidatus Sulfotelmatobacter sp.]
MKGAGAPIFTGSFGCSSGALTNRPDGYSFDASGNLLNDASNTLTYDAENRVVLTSPRSLRSGPYDVWTLNCSRFLLCAERVRGARQQVAQESSKIVPLGA